MESTQQNQDYSKNENFDNPNTANAPENGKWVFDAKVTNAFSDMLQRSIPGYNDMRDVIYRIANKPIQTHDHQTRHSAILDLGSSTGGAIEPFYASNAANGYILTDISEPMIDKLKSKYQGASNVTVAPVDLRQRSSILTNELRTLCKNYTTDGHASLIMAILTLIFVPINFRPNVLRAVYETLSPNGMFVITEKLQGSDWLTDNLLVDTYHRYKHDHGYSWEAIERKRLSLEGVQIPLTEASNIDMLHRAGFSHVECVHRHLSFATFVAIK